MVKKTPDSWLAAAVVGLAVAGALMVGTMREVDAKLADSERAGAAYTKAKGKLADKIERDIAAGKVCAAKNWRDEKGCGEVARQLDWDIEVIELWGRGR